MDSPKSKIKTLLRSLLPQKPEAPAEKQSLEEQKEILELAVLYDRLVKEPGWEKALKVAAQEVNSEIVEATRMKYEPDRQRVHVIRWDAKRELLDNLTGYIEGILKSRDEILSQHLEESQRLRESKHEESYSGT